MTSNVLNYIANLPVGADTTRFAETDDAAVPTGVDPDHIPDGIVTGTNLVEFEGDVDPVLRSSVAMSLLAAQRVANQDVVVADPDQWLERHNTVLKNLNWVVESGGKVDQEFRKVDVAVHEAIIPLLTTALGGAAAGTSLIVKALEQMKQVNQDTPWITLWDNESRRFNVSEYHFTRVATDRDRVRMHLAAARFDASFGRKQVLFFKVTRQHAKFEMASAGMAADAPLLRMTNEALKNKLATLTNAFIRELDLGPL